MRGFFSVLGRNSFFFLAEFPLRRLDLAFSPMTTDHSIERHVRHRLLERLEAWPGVLLLGPRQSGKTTLAQALLVPLGFAHRDFDDDDVRESARQDPRGFLADLPDKAILDEVQRVPEIILPLKRRIDGDRERANFLLTGSCALLRAMPDSLAGRLEHLRLFPLSECEREGVRPTFLDRLFAADFRMGKHRSLGEDLRRRIVRGGYPVIRPDTPPGFWRGWYASYVSSLMERDASTLYRVSRPGVLMRLLAAAAAQTARPLNSNRLAAAFEVTRPTVRQYLRLLERLFALEMVPSWNPPWGDGLSHTMAKAPKLHVGDTGLACGLLGIDADTLATKRDLLGQMTETFVFQELRRQAGGRDDDPRFFHYRERDGAEVDIVIQGAGGKIAGIEVKAGATARPADFRGLRRLAEAAGQSFACGVVLCDGENCVPYGDRMRLVPIRALWESAPGG